MSYVQKIIKIDLRYVRMYIFGIRTIRLILIEL